nr:hypothetical protein [Tanacetum cinerariifolium]
VHVSLNQKLKWTTLCHLQEFTRSGDGDSLKFITFRKVMEKSNFEIRRLRLHIQGGIFGVFLSQLMNQRLASENYGEKRFWRIVNPVAMIQQIVNYVASKVSLSTLA